jgi:hypothetical protein
MSILDNASQFLSVLLTPWEFFLTGRVMWLPFYSTGLEIPKGQDEVCTPLLYYTHDFSFRHPNQDAHGASTSSLSSELREEGTFVTFMSLDTESTFSQFCALAPGHPLVCSRCSINIMK